jgi:presenilin-like A22 family membrane protease
MTRHRACLGLWLLYVAVQLTVFVLLVVAPEQAPTNPNPAPNPSSATHGYFFAGVLVVEAIVVFTVTQVGYLRRLVYRVYRFFADLPDYLKIPGALTIWATLTKGDTPVVALAILAAAVGAVKLWRVNYWWLFNLKTLALGVLASLMLGSTIGPTPIILFLVLVAVYDAVAVYVTGHMQKLLEDAPSWLPMYFLVPREGYRPFVEVGDVEFSDREFGVLGLGDAVMPAMLISASLSFGAGETAALGALVGAQAGFGLLTLIALRFDRAHAGLPPIVACTLIGWFVAGGVV